MRIEGRNGAIMMLVFSHPRACLPADGWATHLLCGVRERSGHLVSALTVAGALAAVLLKNIVHCALAVTTAFLGLALLFLQLDAQFAGFAQILVYIGAVAILIVFAILLTRGSELPKEGVFSKTWLAGLVIAAAVFAVLGWVVLRAAPWLPQTTQAPAVTVNASSLHTAVRIAVIVAMHEKEGAD